MSDYRGDDAMQAAAKSMQADMVAFVANLTPEQKQGLILFTTFWITHVSAGHKNIFLVLREILGIKKGPQAQ